MDWRQAGISCGKLEHLATCFDFFYDAHRADQDCLALLEILSRPLPHHSHTVLKAVMDHVNIPRVRVWANNARDSSRCLSLHGYKWGPNSKCSYTIIPAAQLTDELVWLQQHVYQYQGGAPTITIESLPPQVRFADRRYQSHSRTQYLRDLLHEANHGQAC